VKKIFVKQFSRPADKRQTLAVLRFSRSLAYEHNFRVMRALPENDFISAFVKPAPFAVKTGVKQFAPLIFFVLRIHKYLITPQLFKYLRKFPHGVGRYYFFCVLVQIKRKKRIVHKYPVFAYQLKRRLAVVFYV